ncbi:DNA polymerase IV [Janibacter melonis]|uniref:DNA-directed DNA polymerase n=1 Tax=Janibacter melonis TaxID=262209 RepID=A0A176QB26_9MICO|nr:DNA polymerase IV [Janibacter melonis]OAB86854.1 DNA polymerase IV [Janibacter melonis]
MARWVLHVDLDQFIAAVEVLRRPELAGLPVVVGGRGDPSERAVVSTASYEAREFGIRSGMPLKIAVRRCPQAVFLPVDAPEYDAASAVVMETLRAQPGATVQVLGWDEAFVGIETKGDDVEGDEAEAVAYAQAIRAAVFEATQLHCSIGVGDTTVRAKIATDLGKPRGVFLLTRRNWSQVMGDRPTTSLWGVGARIGSRLATHGYETVDQLGAADDEVLAGEFGPRMGPHYGRLGRGEGPDVVDDTPWVARAHGRETTYQRDLTDPAEVEAALRTLAEHVVEDIRAEGRACQRVHLKVRFAPFFTTTRIRTLSEATDDPFVIARTATELLRALDDDRPIRLLGVRAEMVPPEGGYERPRTTGRGGPAAAEPSAEE